MTKQGPGPAAFLLLAEGHLRKARGMLPCGKPYDQDHHRQLLLYEAADNIRYVRKLLNEKEEPCKP